MTQIHHLRISGFKGIEQLEVSPGAINIVTGRNNTGKTSLLESIDLIFNPRKVAEYGSNVGKLISSKQNTASLHCSFLRKQSRLGEFGEGDNEGAQREVGIRPPRESEAASLAMRTLEDIIELNEEYPIRRNYLAEDLYEEGKMVEEKPFQETVRNSVSNFAPEELSPITSGSLVIFSIEGEEYPFIHLGEGFNSVRNEIVHRSIDSFFNKENTEELSKLQDEGRDYLRSIFADILVPRFGRGRFIGDAPPELDGLKFEEEIKRDSSDMDLDQNNAAIRVSKIEKYIKENNMAAGLEDFSVDKLVFQDNGKPYEVPYEFMGDGFQAIVGILWTLFDQNHRGDVLLLEEPENHMHPGYIEKLVRQLIDISRKEGLQLFITTHNIDFLEALLTGELNEEREEYLENQLKLIQMTNSLHQELNYEQTKNKLEELNLDLRGV